VKLFWVSGHCDDIEANEIADELARMGSGSHFCGSEPCMPLSDTIMRHGLNKHTLNTGMKLLAVDSVQTMDKAANVGCDQIFTEFS
jgi:hypothetical protein